MIIMENMCNEHSRMQSRKRSEQKTKEKRKETKQNDTKRKLKEKQKSIIWQGQEQQGEAARKKNEVKAS